MNYEITNCYFAFPGDSEINCTWDHPTLGKIPFTASPNDCEVTGREIHENALSGMYGPVVSYEDSHWYSITNNNVWNGRIYNIGNLMISPTGEQPPNSTNKIPPVPPA